jgi:nucleoside-diphosphate-sugar epimerase
MRVAVIGYGAVGREMTRLLRERGHDVRVVQRRAPADLPAGVEAAAADVLDAESLKNACAGVRALICCLGFPYDSRLWDRAWPSAMSNMLAVCAGQGARFVFADNLYMYGPQDKPLREDMALTEFGRKPRLRAQITRQWLEAHRAGQVEAVAVRASDFYGPRAENSVLAEYGVRRLMQGHPALIPYGVDYLHDFTYTPDFARALVTLLEADSEAYGQAWHAPNAPTQTLRSLLSDAAEMIGAPLRLRQPPRFALKLLGLFDRQVFELEEMSFQTDRPYRVDTRKFAEKFWADATPFAAGLAATIASCRSEGAG